MVVVVGMVWVISLEESGEGLGGQLSSESAPTQPFLPSIRQHCGSIWDAKLDNQFCEENLEVQVLDVVLGPG